MFEVFLFVNPIGIRCYESECEIMAAIDQTSRKAIYHFVPLANMVGIRADMRRRGLSHTNLMQFNEISNATFSALHDYHALKLSVGNKKARRYLLLLQAEINTHQAHYTQALKRSLIQQLDVNFVQFTTARQSRFIEQSMQKDVDLAQKFKVINTPTTVIFDCDHDESGIIFEGCVRREELEAILTDHQSIVETNSLHLL